MTARNGAFSPISVRAKLNAYRNLFIKSGAWQRMVSHFDKMKEQPCYVSDLDSEIDSIMEWYIQRFFEVDAYFGITDTDGIDEIKNEKLKVKNENIIYDLNGRSMDFQLSLFNSQLKNGLYIQGGKKYLIQR